MRTEAQEMLDLNAMHSVSEEKTTITTDSEPAVPAMPKDTHPPKCP